MLARASHGYLGAGKACDLFPAAHTTFLFGKPAASGCVCNARGKGSFMASRTMPQSTGTKGVPQVEVQAAGQARGIGENCSAWSPKGWYTIKNSVQQPGEHCKGKRKCDLTKPRISIYLDGLQSVTKFRLIATLVRNHHYWLVYILVFFQLFHPSLPFNLGS